MVKRERERETAEDIKQAFRVFDKVRWCRVTCTAANEPSLKLYKHGIGPYWGLLLGSSHLRRYQDN